jgi:hypothetical protein
MDMEVAFNGFCVVTFVECGGLLLSGDLLLCAVK